MPTEDETLGIIGGADESSTNNPLDLATFADQDVREGYARVVIITEDEKDPITIEVPSDSLYCGEVEARHIPQCDMEEISDKYDVCYMSNPFCTSGWYTTRGEDINYSNEYESFIFNNESTWGITHEGEDWFHCEEEYIVINDTRYLNGEVARNNDCYVCDGCDEWYHCDDHDFDDCENGGDSEHWDNTRHYAPNTLSNWKEWGTNSPTFSISNGMKYTFGVEVETSRGNIYDYGDLNCKSVYDGSVSGNEYVTGVLKGDYGFNHLKKICDRITTSGHELNSRCGLHVHVGGTFNRRFTIMLLKLCYQIQNDIWLMMPPSRANNSYSKPIPTWASDINFQNFRNKLGQYIYGSESHTLDRDHNKKRRHDHYCSTRYRWVNINNFSTASGKPTVEFRSHSATMNYDKIRNWTLICMAIVSYAENNQKRIWSNIDSITLEEVIMSSLGDNIGSQIFKYYQTRCESFKHFYGQEGSHFNYLPKSIIDRNGKIM